MFLFPNLFFKMMYRSKKEPIIRPERFHSKIATSLLQQFITHRFIGYFPHAVWKMFMSLFLLSLDPLPADLSPL